MMNKFLIIFLFLGIFFCIYKSKVIEGLKCDPNKPKVYNRKLSKKECQKLKQSENSDNLKIFEKELDGIKKELQKTSSEYNKMREQMSENTININKFKESLGDKKKKKDKKDNEVDIADEQSKARQKARSYEDKDQFKF